MINRERAKSAADELLAAAVLGEDWGCGLQHLAEAADAGGVTLMRLRHGLPSATISSIGWAEADAAMLAGAAPSSPRRFFPDCVFGQGFRGDTDVWTEAELSRDPYFQEFLRPRGVFYHARARLWGEDDERVSISLKRLSNFGPYERQDVAALDALLPELERRFASLAVCWMRKHRAWLEFFTTEATPCSNLILGHACCERMALMRYISGSQFGASGSLLAIAWRKACSTGRSRRV
ncbi:MAG TPA: hypothetical protein VFR68_01320 [Candidatus Dormibacteraeota bacterium]|nr:hypothetical protein [Candidatus Dormibacteraeota bacterium]